MRLGEIGASVSVSVSDIELLFSGLRIFGDPRNDKYKKNTLPAYRALWISGGSTSSAL
jgi:hypothetical protein